MNGNASDLDFFKTFFSPQDRLGPREITQIGSVCVTEVTQAKAGRCCGAR